MEGKRSYHVVYVLEIVVDYFLPEWCQCQAHQPEVHHTPWKAHDGDAQEQAKAEMGQRNPNATNEEPKYIHDHVKTSSVLRLVNNM